MTHDADHHDDPFSIAPAPRPPVLPGDVIVRNTLDDLIDALAADLYLHAHNCVRAFGSFHLALSGGSTPLPLYRRLMYDPAYRDLPWSHAHLWIVDERRVPFDDDRSNFGAISGLIVDQSGIPESHVHPIHACDDDADVRYERELVQSLAQRGQGRDRLDYVLLGMGADGHTASLFPRSPALREMRRLARINTGPTVTPPDRVTMTLPLINASRFIAVMVTGDSKRDTIARVVRGAESSNDGARIDELPILGVRPIGGALRWYLDADACPPATAAGAARP